MKRSRDKSSNKTAIHTVGAWARQNGLLPGQVKADDKSKDIRAIPKLLSRLGLKGAVVTIDARQVVKGIVFAHQISGFPAPHLAFSRKEKGSACRNLMCNRHI
ncbi:MAG: hypothetical protein ACU843_15040 [Gammaproteobacteria bacterium]